MKKLIYYVGAIMLATFLFTSCKTDAEKITEFCEEGNTEELAKMLQVKEQKEKNHEYSGEEAKAVEEAKDQCRDNHRDTYKAAKKINKK